MSDHQNIQTQWSDGPPKFSALSQIVTWPKNRSNRRHSRPIIQETRYRSRPFSRNKTSVYNHAGHELLRSRLTIRSRLFTELKICVHNHAGYELLRLRSTINPADVVSKRHPPQLAPVVSATDWPHTKSWDIYLDCHIGKYRGVLRSKIVFLESVTFQFHACMLSLESEVAQSLLIKSYGQKVSDLSVGIALSHRHVGFFG